MPAALLIGLLAFGVVLMIILPRAIAGGRRSARGSGLGTDSDFPSTYLNQGQVLAPSDGAPSFDDSCAAGGSDDSGSADAGGTCDAGGGGDSGGDGGGDGGGSGGD